ncbi:unnamed protein product [Mortierella alpina]
MIRPRLCQQCLSTLVRTATITPKTALHPQKLAPVASFSTSHSANAAFLRPGPGRELGIAFKKTAETNPKHPQGQRAQSLCVSNKTVAPTPGAASSLSASQTPSTKRSSYWRHFRERLIKGGGNGGQKINKTNSNVELKHLETGIVVQCQATRSLPQNRKLARRILIGRLDEYYNGELSKRGQKAEKIRERKKRMARKSAKKYRAAGTDAGSESNDDDDGEDGDGHGDKDDGGGKEETLKTNSRSMPEAIIHSTTLEEILAGDNKKPSRRKAARKE